MAFKIGKPRTVSTTVETVDGQTFGVTFALASDEELSKFASPNDALRALVVGLDDIVAEDDTPLGFSAEVLDGLLASADISLAMSRAYKRATVDAALGN